MLENFSIRSQKIADDLSWAMLVVIATTVTVSVKLYAIAIDLEVIFPAELIIGCVSLLFLLRTFSNSHQFDFRILKHPLAILVIADLGVSLLSHIAAEDPMVSLKWLIVRTAYATTFFILPLVSGSITILRLRKLLLFHALGVILIIGWVGYAAITHGFERSISNFSCMPFYNDHTIYAAALLFALATLIYEAYYSYFFERKLLRSVFYYFLAFTVIGAIALSFTRAAWLSVAATFVIVPVFLYKPKPVVWATGILFFIILGMLVWKPLQNVVLQKGGDADSDNAGISQILWSFANVTTDASNRERVLRWSRSIKIANDNKWLGCGPGNFKFVYASYPEFQNHAVVAIPPMKTNYIQRSWEPVKDLIVRKNPQKLYVDPGTAHSEYLLALSERGPLALACFIGIFVICVVRYLKRTDTTDPWPNNLRLILTMAMIAYAIQAVFNNFLDDCKIALPFYLVLVLFIRSDQKKVVF